MEEQKKVVTQYRKDPQSINPYRLLVLDDVITDAGQSDELKDLAVMARHFYIGVMLTDQHPQMLATAVRNNTDVVLVFRLHEDRALEYLARAYMPQLKLNNAMETLQRYAFKGNKAGDPSQCLVIFNRKGGPLKDRVNFLQAPDPGKFVIGCKQYWNKQSTVDALPAEADSDDEDTDSEDDWPEVQAPPPHPILKKQ